MAEVWMTFDEYWARYSLVVAATLPLLVAPASPASALAPSNDAIGNATVIASCRSSHKFTGRLSAPRFAITRVRGEATNCGRCPGMAEVWMMFDEYVAWYSWAKSNLVRDAMVCHAAATAATQALAVGAGRDAATAAALDAAADEAAISGTRASYGYRHLYVEWFIWAKANLRLSDERCHEVAQAALQPMAAGGSQQSTTVTTTRPAAASSDVGVRNPLHGGRLHRRRSAADAASHRVRARHNGDGDA